MRAGAHQVRLENRLGGEIERVARLREGRQLRFKQRFRRGRQGRHVEAEIVAEIVGDRAEGAGERQDTGTLARRLREAREDFGGIDQFVERLQERDAGVRHQRAHDGVVAGERAGMRVHRRLGALAAARMHHQDRLAGGAGALRRRQEIRRLAHLLDIDDDGVGRLVGGEEVDEVGEVQPGFVAGGHRIGDLQVARLERRGGYATSARRFAR